MAAVAPASAPSGFASGHYHFSVQGVGRGNGAPVVAKAAYRSGECLYDERIGQMFDYRGGAERVIDSFVMARDEAPAWMQHAAREARQRAWNEAERADPKANARIATEIVVGLPHELSDTQRKELLSAFVRRIVEKHGVFADVAIHTAHDDRNIHAHVLLSHRELGPEGFGEIANRRTIMRKHRGQVKEMTTAGLAATPADIKKLREQWAQDVNRAYEQAGLDIRVDHRSFEDRGIKETPTIHLGPTAAEMERKGQRSDRGDINRMIEVGNAEVRRLEAVKQQLEAQIIDLAARRAEREARGGGDFENGSSRKRRTMAPEDVGYDIGESQRADFAKKVESQRIAYFDMIAEKERADRFLENWQIQHDEGERNKRTLQKDQWQREAEGDIADPRIRALVAAGESRDFLQTVRREGAMIAQEHNEIERAIALEADPDKKQLLTLKRDIQHADYMAITTERIAAMSNFNSGQHQDAERENAAWLKIGTELRKERLELQEQMADREMDTINEAVQKINEADRARADFRADIGGPVRDGNISSTVPPSERTSDGAAVEQDNRPAPETAQEAAETREARAGGNVPGQAERPVSEAERPAEIIQSGPSRPENTADAESTREYSERHLESNIAANLEVTDAKAAKKAAITQSRGEIEASIERGQERGYENSR